MSASIRADLLIVDDSFPWKFSDFRYAEFVYLLERVPEAHLITTGAMAILQSGMSGTPEESFREFQVDHPELSGRVHRNSTIRGDVEASVAYCSFLSNAYKFLGAFGHYRIPFGFVLYPGGMLGDTKASDSMMRKVFGSPWFRFVVTTQSLVTSVALKRGGVPRERIFETFGIPVHPVYEGTRPENRRLYGVHKPTIDVCFVAYRYMPQGIDKGYDLFIGAASMLHRIHRNVRFHVVGGFTPSDIDVSSLGDSISFHKPKTSEELAKFYMGMDALVSPNPGIWSTQGVFHGFPTGSSIGAGMTGVTVFASDPLNQNRGLVEDKDFVRVDPNVSDICLKMDAFLRSPERLHALGVQGQSTFRRLFGNEAQIEPRLGLIRRHLPSRESAPQRIETAPSHVMFSSVSESWKPFPFFAATPHHVTAYHYIHCAKTGSSDIRGAAEMWRNAASRCAWMSFISLDDILGLRDHPMWREPRNYFILHDMGVPIPEVREAAVAMRVIGASPVLGLASICDVVWCETPDTFSRMVSIHPHVVLAPSGAGMETAERVMEKFHIPLSINVLVERLKKV